MAFDEKRRLVFPASISLGMVLELLKDIKDEQLLDFILKLDEEMADYDFTLRLRDKLTEALEAEDAPDGE